MWLGAFGPWYTRWVWGLKSLDLGHDPVAREEPVDLLVEVDREGSDRVGGTGFGFAEALEVTAPHDVGGHHQLVAAELGGPRHRVRIGQ